MASPVLRPGAGWPRISTEGRPLYRSRRGEPYAHRVVAKEEKGTMAPSRFRTNHFSRSSGFIRNGASDCRNTFFTRPLSRKSPT